jgi:hypothetical protein
MKPELEKILVEKYPKLLREHGGDPKLTCMAWGIECGDGWYKILDHLLSYLNSLSETKLIINYTKEYREKYKDDKDYYTRYYSIRIDAPQIVISQVKEKYGTLTVYYNTDSVNQTELPEDTQKIIDQEDYNKKFRKFYDKIDFAINYAEYQSSITCEQTGKDGRLYTKGWHRTMCDEVAIKNGYDPKEASISGIRWEEY